MGLYDPKVLNSGQIGHIFGPQEQKVAEPARRNTFRRLCVKRWTHSVLASGYSGRRLKTRRQRRRERDTGVDGLVIGILSVTEHFWKDDPTFSWIIISSLMNKTLLISQK